MPTFNQCLNGLEKAALDARYHDLLSLVKGFRNGLVYGTKVRLPHALVITAVFKSGPLRDKITSILQATREHAVQIGSFSVAYKSLMILLRRIKSGEDEFDCAIAGMLGGYLVFGRNYTAINRQIMMYVFCQFLFGFSRLLTAPPTKGKNASAITIKDSKLREAVAANGWGLFTAALSACMMYLYRWYPGSLQASARSSMHYIYTASDKWVSLWTLLMANE